MSIGDVAKDIGNFNLRGLLGWPGCAYFEPIDGADDQSEPSGPDGEPAERQLRDEPAPGKDGERRPHRA